MLYGCWPCSASSTCVSKLAWALLLLSLVLTPFLGELLVSLRRPIFYDRTLIWTTLPYYMLMAVGIRGLVGRCTYTTATDQSRRPRPITDARAAVAAAGRGS